MKYFIYLFALLSFIIFSACDRMAQNPTDSATKIKTDTKTDKQLRIVNIDEMNSNIDRMQAENSARLAKKGTNVPLDMTDIVVPDDYPTIQEAVDAASPGTNIRVKEGVYAEQVYVLNDDLIIKAVGDVTLQGQFRIYSSNITIRDFKINFQYSAGIICYYGKGIQIENNTVYYSATGIILIECGPDCSIKNNTVHNNNFGIGVAECSNISVKNNTSYNNYYSGIVIQTETQNTEIKDNTSYGNGQAGILVSHSVINSLVKDNIIYNNGWGIVVQEGSRNNEFIENTANSNYLYGIFLNPPVYQNLFKDNEALQNGSCDIVNLATDNTFLNNIADCTVGL